MLFAVTLKHKKALKMNHLVTALNVLCKAEPLAEARYPPHWQPTTGQAGACADPDKPQARPCRRPELIRAPKTAVAPCGATAMRSLPEGGDQSPNIFWRNSRRCCASSDKLAVGRAIKRPTPMGSPVSSQ